MNSESQTPMSHKYIELSSTRRYKDSHQYKIESGLYGDFNCGVDSANLASFLWIIKEFYIIIIFFF